MYIAQNSILHDTIGDDLCNQLIFAIGPKRFQEKSQTKMVQRPDGKREYHLGLNVTFDEFDRMMNDPDAITVI